MVFSSRLSNTVVVFLCFQIFYNVASARRTILLGRQIVNTSNVLVQYGQGTNRTVQFSGGSETQQAEFVDRMQFSVETNQSLRMNVDLKKGVNPGTLPANTMSLNSYMWIVNTSLPFNKINAQMLVPCKSPLTSHLLYLLTDQQSTAICSSQWLLMVHLHQPC